MKKIFIFFIIIILFGCYNNSGIKLNLNKKTKNIKKTAEEEKTIDHINYDVSTNELVYLFFDKSFFAVKTPDKTISAVKENKNAISADDFKAVVDWQVKGGRQIRLLNLKTGKEYIIKDWEKTGEAVLLERNLFYYKFKIGNSIIKVKR